MSNRLGQVFGALLMEAGARVAGRVAGRISKEPVPAHIVVDKALLVRHLASLEAALMGNASASGGDIRQQILGMLKAVRDLSTVVHSGALDVK